MLYYIWEEPKIHTQVGAWQQHDTNDESRSSACVSGCFCILGTQNPLGAI